MDTGETPLVIFRTRPSLVPPLICFWVFLFGAAGVGALLSGGMPALTMPLSIADLGPYTGLLLALGLGLLLELVVIYVMIRNFAARYELTTRTLTVRFRGKRARIAVMDVYGAECRQSGFQRIFGIGTLDLDVSVKGELAQVSLRDIPHCQRRIEQIKEVIGE
ncbi:MAG: PH domain-containing protein [Chloroflexi bacterium]|nr:MAG: PH domain-containing protein [Chloroflexota bacterium]